MILAVCRFIFDLCFLFLLGIGWVTTLGELNPRVDTGCHRSLRLQRLMLRRLLGFCWITALLNLYKAFWATSLSGCFFRPKCAIEVNSMTKLENIVNNTSYFAPDLLVIVYWLVFLLRPLSLDLSISPSSKEKSVTSTETFALHGESGVDGEGERNSISSEIFEPNAISPHLIDAKRLSKPRLSKSRLSSRWLGSQLVSDEQIRSRRTYSLDLLQGMSSFFECRELHISLSEMVLVDRRMCLPIPALFSGRDTFVILYVRGLPLSTPNSPRPLSSKLHTSTLTKEDEDGDVDWIEVGRSDCNLNKVSPVFLASFVVPLLPNTEEYKVVRWRIDIYNAAEVDLSFRVDEANLDEEVLISLSLSVSVLISSVCICSHLISPQALIGVVYFDNSELEQIDKNMAGDSDSDDEIDEAPSHHPLGERGSLSKLIIVRDLPQTYIRLGGSMKITTYCFKPFSQVITELHGINSIAQWESDRIDVSASSNQISLQATRSDALMRSFILSPSLHSVNNTSRSSSSIHRQIRVGEEMIESPYSFSVPLAYMHFLLSERRMELEVSRFCFFKMSVTYTRVDDRRATWRQLSRTNR
jgi:hypothetical protein